MDPEWTKISTYLLVKSPSIILDRVHLRIIAHQSIINTIKEVGVAGKKIVLWGHGMGAYIAISFSGVYPEVCSYVYEIDRMHS